jgi:hypothetical protein
MARLQDRVGSDPRRVTDVFIESYVSWREACRDVQAAYRRWQTCKPPQRVLAFAGYAQHWIVRNTPRMSTRARQ